MLNNRFNKKRYHFFLGGVFTNPSEYKIMNKIMHNLRLPKDPRKKLKTVHWNNRFFTNLVYLGYLEESVAKEYMNNVFSVLLKQIISKVGVLTCKYTDFKVKSDGSYNRVSIKFNDDDNIIERIIVPYLHKNGILPIYPSKKNILKPTIDIFHYKDNVQIDDETINDIKQSLKNESFVFDHISLIKGETVDIRAGTASIHDRMNMEEVEGYRFNLKTGNKINNTYNTYNKKNNQKNILSDVSSVFSF